MRSAAGLAAVVEGVAVLSRSAPLTAGGAAGTLAISSGLFLLIGFLTPLAGTVVGLAMTFVSLSPTPGVSPRVIDSGAAATLVVVVAIASALIGPGAFSIDSYLFGRREIVIPRERESS